MSVTTRRPLDVLIHGGRIIDGAGNPARRADIAVRDGHVEAIGLLPGAEAETIIDATGRYVTPGCVDVHSHTDSAIRLNPLAQSSIRQGITTEIVGNCGGTTLRLEKQRVPDFFDSDLSGAVSLGVLFDTLEGEGITPNLAYLMGHNTMRARAGIIGSNPTEDQLKAMDRDLEKALDDGAFGLSTALEFEPGRVATIEEITRYAKISGKHRAMYVSHIRNRDAGLIPAVEEFISIVRASYCRGEISHLNVRENTGCPEGGWAHAVGLMEDARAQGLDILADMTPLNYGTGGLLSILPPWLRADGSGKAAAMLCDPNIRQRLRGDCDRYWRFITRGEWHRVQLQNNPGYPELNGLYFPEIARLWGCDEWECFFTIAVAALQAGGSVTAAGRLFSDEHMRETIAHPLFSLGVDGISTLTEGPLARNNPFPLHYMGMVHYLAFHVKVEHTLRLEEAIRKMTSMTATHFSLARRGLLREGYHAAITVFDYDKLEEISTVEHPFAYARGVGDVLVNGIPVIRGGEHTGARPGKCLKRQEK